MCTEYTALGLLGLVYLEWGRNEEAGRNLAEALDVVNNSSCMTYVTLFSKTIVSSLVYNP